MTVSQLSSEMTSQELTEWMAYDRFDPIGGYRQDLQTAYLLYEKRGGDDKNISDFLPVDPNPMTDEQRAEVERVKKIEELEVQTAQMIAMFDSM